MCTFNEQLREAVEEVDGNEVGLVCYWTKEDILIVAENAGYVIDDYERFLAEVNESDYFPSQGEELIEFMANSEYTSKYK